MRRGVSVMHDRMFRAILRAPLSWFTVTPIGRVLSTFSRDTDAIDEALPDAIMMVTIYVMILGTTLGVVIRVLVSRHPCDWSNSRPRRQIEAVAAA